VRVPLHCTASGKVLLAFGNPSVIDAVCARGLRRYGANTIVTSAALRSELDRIRRNRFAIANDEGAGGTRCVAAPIFGRGKELRGSLSITVPGRTIPIDFENLGAVVRIAAQAVSRALQQGPSDGSLRASLPVSGAARWSDRSQLHPAGSIDRRLASLPATSARVV